MPCCCHLYKLGASPTYTLSSISSKILTDVVFAGSGTRSSVKTTLLCFLARPRKLFQLRPWLWFPRLLGLSPPFRLPLLSRAVLAVLVWSCNVSNSCFRVLVTKTRNILDFLFWVLVTMSSCFTFSNCRLTFTAFARPKGSL